MFMHSSNKYSYWEPTRYGKWTKHWRKAVKNINKIHNVIFWPFGWERCEMHNKQIKKFKVISVVRRTIKKKILMVESNWGKEEKQVGLLEGVVIQSLPRDVILIWTQKDEKDRTKPRAGNGPIQEERKVCAKALRRLGMSSGAGWRRSVGHNNDRETTQGL